MGVTMAARKWAGGIRQVQLGAGARRPVPVGGGKGLPLATSDAEFPHTPALALEITDVDPPRWPETVRAPWQDVIGRPADAARKAVGEFGADLVMLNLVGTHPDRGDRTPERAVEDVRAVLDAVDVPLIVKGPGTGQKQNDVLSAVAAAFDGEGLVLHSACQEDYKTLAAVSVAYGHVLVAESPIDLNIAKQLNILLSESNVDLDRVLIDPLTGGLGYGLEYTYSVMQRIRLAALGGDAMLSSPMICLLGDEVWKAKETKVRGDQEPLWGDLARRGIHWEVVTALPLLEAGADVVVFRHPEALARLRPHISAWFAQ